MAPKQFLNVMTLAALLLAPATALAEPDAGVPSPEEANTLLVDGNARFVHGTSKHPHQSTKRVAETSAGQHPFVTVLSCSDSRVPPELLFDEGFGDVFSVRVAGNVANSDEMGSVEYGVDHLGTPLLVVMGHTKCGAVTAVATHATVHGHIPALVAKIGVAVDAAHAKMPNATDAEIVPEAIKANVFETMATMLRESDAVRERVDSGKTRMIGAVYDISTGSVTWLGPHPDQTQLVEKAKASAPAEHGETKGAHGGAGHDAPKHGGASHDAPKHGDAGATDKPDEAHDAHETPAPAPLPLPSPPPPLAFAVVALLCTLGGGISGRLSK
jgi:carbonic anhydrase